MGRHWPAGVVLLLCLAAAAHSADGPPPPSSRASPGTEALSVPADSTWRLEKYKRQVVEAAAARLQRHQTKLRRTADDRLKASHAATNLAITKLPSPGGDDHLQWCLIHPYTPCLPTRLDFGRGRSNDRGVCVSPGPEPPRYLPSGWEEDVLEPERDQSTGRLQALHQGRLPSRPSVAAPALMLFLHRHRPLAKDDPRWQERVLESQLFGGVSVEFGVQPHQPPEVDLPAGWAAWENALDFLYTDMTRGSIKTKLARLPRLPVDGLEARYWPRAHMVVSYLIQAYIYYDTTIFAEANGEDAGAGPDLGVPEALVAAQRELARRLLRGPNTDDSLPGASFSWADMFTNNIDYTRTRMHEGGPPQYPLVDNRSVRLQAQWLRMDPHHGVYPARERLLSSQGVDGRILSGDPCERAFVLITVEQQYRFGKVIGKMNATLAHAAVVQHELDAWEEAGSEDLGDLWDRLLWEDPRGGDDTGTDVIMNHLHQLSVSLGELRGAVLELIGSFDGMTEENCPPVWWWNAVAVWAQAPRPNKGPNGLQFVNVLAMDAFLRRRSFASDLGRSVGGNLEMVMPNHREFLDAILRSPSVPALVARMHGIIASSGDRLPSDPKAGPGDEKPLDLGAEREQTDGIGLKSSRVLRQMSVALAAHNDVVAAHVRWLQAHMAKAAGYIDEGMKHGKPRGTSGGTVRAGEARVVDHSGGGDVSLRDSDREAAKALARQYKPEDVETSTLPTVSRPLMRGVSTAQARTTATGPSSIRCEAGGEQHEGTVAILVMLHESAAERKLSSVTSLVPLKASSTALHKDTYRLVLKADFSLEREVTSGILKDTVSDIGPGNVLSLIPVTKSWAWTQHIDKVKAKSLSTPATRHSINSMLPWIQRMREYRSILGDQETFPCVSSYSGLVGASLSIQHTNIGMEDWLALVEWGPLAGHVIHHIAANCMINHFEPRPGMSWDDVMRTVDPGCLEGLDLLNLTTPMKARRFSIVSATEKRIEFIMKAIKFTAGTRDEVGMVSRMVEDAARYAGVDWYVDIHRSLSSGPVLKGLRYLKGGASWREAGCTEYNTISVFASGGTWRVAGWAVLTDTSQRICSIATLWILAASIERVVDFSRLVDEARRPIRGMDIRIFISRSEDSVECLEAREAVGTSSIHIVCNRDPSQRGYSFFGDQIQREILPTRQRLMEELRGATHGDTLAPFERVMDMLVDTRHSKRVLREYSGKEVVFVVGTSLFEAEIRHAYFHAMVEATVKEDEGHAAPWEGMPGGKEGNRPWSADGEAAALEGYRSILKTRMSAIARGGQWAAEVYDSNKAVRKKSGHLAELATTRVTCDAMKKYSGAHCFVSWSGGVYDITDYVRRNAHPGSSGILVRYCGKDITDAFALVGHTAHAVFDLEKHFVATLSQSSDNPIPVSEFSSCKDNAALWGHVCVSIPALGRTVGCGPGYLLVRAGGLRIVSRYTMHIASYRQLVGMWTTGGGDTLMIRVGGVLFGTPTMVIRIRAVGPQFYALGDFVSTAWGCAREEGTAGVASPYAWGESVTGLAVKEDQMPWQTPLCFECANALGGGLMAFQCGREGPFSDYAACSQLRWRLREDAEEFGKVVRLAWLLESDPDKGITEPAQLVNARFLVCKHFMEGSNSIFGRDLASFSEAGPPSRADGPEAQCAALLEMLGVWRGGFCSPVADAASAVECIKLLSQYAGQSLQPHAASTFLYHLHPDVGAAPATVPDEHSTPSAYCNAVYEGKCRGAPSTQ